MSLTFNEMEEAIRDAQEVIRQFKFKINTMAELIAGNLRSGRVDSWTLDQLKKELKNYNMCTHCWKD